MHKDMHKPCMSFFYVSPTIVEQFKKRTRTYRVRQVGRLYATQLYERVTLFLKLFRYMCVRFSQHHIKKCPLGIFL